MGQRQIHFVGLSFVLITALLIGPRPSVASIYMATSPPTSVRIDSDSFRTAIESGLLSQLMGLGVSSSGVNEHWINNVEINEYGEFIEVNVTSLFRVQVTASAENKEVLCDSTWSRYMGVWWLKPTDSLPQCELLVETYPLSSVTFSKLEWFSQSSAVDRKTFESIYREFTSRLILLDVYSPSWTGDAWILRGSIDSTMHIRNVWIYASTLVDRYAIDVERRAECHGEGYWDELSGWRAVKPASCRIQDYRHIENCAGPADLNCEWEWVPCEGNFCRKP